MVHDMRKFESAEDFLRSIDQEIQDIRSRLGEYLRRVEEAKAKAEMLRKFEEVLGRLGAKPPASQSQEITLGELRIIINPTPSQELEALVNVVRDLQNRLNRLERLKQNLEPLRQIAVTGMQIEVLYEDGVPVQVFLRLA